MNQAIGMIETKGLLALIEATDAMLKSSEVKLLGKNKVGGGLNTVLITGDVAAVETAVQAAVASIARLGHGVLVGSHVIARPEIAPERFVQENIDREQQVARGVESALESSPNSSSGSNVAEQETIVDEKIEVIESSGTIDIVVTEQNSAAQSDEKSPVEEVDSEASVPKISETSSREQLLQQLSQLKVVELRKLAKEQRDLRISKKDIYRTSKEKLIAVLLDCLLTEE